jgi:hypothetical protein
MNVFSLPYDTVFSQETIEKFVLDTFPETPAHLLEGPPGENLRYAHRRKVELKQYRAERAVRVREDIEELVRTGALTRVEGGYSRGSKGSEVQHFMFDGEWHKCLRSDYPEEIARLREIKASRSPSEQAKRDTVRRIAELESQLNDLKKGA